MRKIKRPCRMPYQALECAGKNLLMLQKSKTAYTIAKTLQRFINTILHEIRRGSIDQIKAGKKIQIYLADTEQTRYAKNRKTLPYQALECKDFIHYTEESKTQRVVDRCRCGKGSHGWITDYSHEVIGRLEDLLNGLPWKILRYKTPKELFYRQLDLHLYLPTI